MRVSTTSFLTLYLTTFLADLGGSLGLWLGLGVLQVAGSLSTILLAKLHSSNKIQPAT